ncbi:MAG TPA: hypothetical protein VMR08_03600 [Patescibacteria group bacterium]|jgi:hypothetical protein|nr:hypothetical protein [Patescibacteria group bacterium]
MTTPELRLIEGEDSTEKHFITFVNVHSSRISETDDETISLREGHYSFTGGNQFVQFDTVAFEVEEQEEYPGEFCYSIRLTQSKTQKAVYELLYYDHPELGFMNEESEKLDAEEAEREPERILSLLSAAEASGHMRKT